MLGARLVGGLLAAGFLASPPSVAAASADFRGWGYLVRKLVEDGVPRASAERAFADSRMPAFDRLDFSLHPGESHAMYRGLLSARSVREAHACFAEHRHVLRRVERETGVPGDVVAAILHVESRCGRYTGDQVVLWRLARLAMAAEPRNLHRNLVRHELLAGPRATFDVEQLTRQRGAYLESTFYPEVLATFQMADRLGIDPLGIRGSIAGAFGLPQFLPSSYLKFGTDGDGDGRVSLYDPDDAVASCARYLQANGWRPGIDRAQRRRVIWSYNRSTPYIDTVLALAERLPSP
ncbi:MAG TPA: lytic murein transglycosylase [Candidatus Limnocylindria bacterium]|nr:lytic murein transglycosylase [Candidatus Limnocylindria bacterium]